MTQKYASFITEQQNHNSLRTIKEAKEQYTHEIDVHPAGWDNVCEYDIDDAKGYDTGKTKPEVIHAESNAIAKLAKSSNSGNQADIFITHSPCMECAKLIYQSGIKRVWYEISYRDDSGINFLRKSGVEVTQT